MPHGDVRWVGAVESRNAPSPAQRPGNGKAGALDRVPVLGKEEPDGLVEAWVRAAGEGRPGDRPKPVARRLEEPASRLGVTDVSGEDHRPGAFQRLMAGACRYALKMFTVPVSRRKWRPAATGHPTHRAASTRSR